MVELKARTKLVPQALCIIATLWVVTGPRALLALVAQTATARLLFR
jgi:hypothetical protein